MKWEKREIVSIEKVRVLLVSLAVILIIIGLINGRPFVLIPAGFVIMHMIVNWQYDKRLGKKLAVNNPVRSIRLFEGEESELELVVKNDSHIPYYNGLVSFTTNQKVESTKNMSASNIHKNIFRIPLTLTGKSVAKIKVPFKANQRGVSRVSELQFTFPHLMNFENILLSYKEHYKTEIIIYPRLEVVQGIKDFPYRKFGNQVSRFSPYEDQQNIMGTKEYVWSDSFRRIHWKASAKNQVLQSKVFERNVTISWTVLMNLSSRSHLGNLYMNINLEKYLSQGAFISQTILNQGYPLELSMNITGPGRIPIHAVQGQGTEQLKKIYELLARVEETDRMIKMENYLHWADTRMNDSNLIVIIGELTSECYHTINKWIREGRKVFWVNDQNETGFIEEITSERLKTNDVG